MADPAITIDGNTSPFRRALQSAREDLNKFAKDGSRSLDDMQSPLGMLRNRFMLVGAAIAGFVAAGQKALGVTSQWIDDSITLGNALGISANEASNLKAALAEEGVEVGTFMSAAQKLSDSIKNNEASIQAMGIATRDAAGNLRPLNDLTVEAIAVVNSYKAGTDRAIAANVAFGRGFEISGDLAKLNAETIARVTEQQQRLGLVVGQENVAAFEAYDAAMKEGEVGVRALWQTLGNQLMPAVTEIINLFNAIAPAAVVVFRGAIGGLMAVFHGLALVVKSVFTVIATGFKNLVDMGQGFGRVMSAVLRGDFSGAAQAASATAGAFKANVGAAFDKITADATDTRDKLWNLFAEGTPVAAPVVAGKSAEGLIKPPKEEKAKKEKEESQMPEFEARLAALRLQVSEENALRQLSKGEELAYWQEVLAQQNVSAKDRLAIEKRVTDMTLTIRREAAMQAQALDAEAIRSAEEIALARVDAEAAALEIVQANGDISRSRALEEEQAFEDRRYDIRRAALEANIQLAMLDPNTSEVEKKRLQSQLEVLELEHLTKRRTMLAQLTTATKQEAEESGNAWKALGQSMSSMWDQGVNAMMNGTLRWRNAVKAVGAELTRWFVVNVVGAQVKEYIAGQARMLAAKMLGLTQETAMQTTASGTIMATKTTEAGVVGTANAVSAGSGAASAMAGIPYVGPILALAAMAAVFAAVMGMTGKVKSARGGYDIPAGVNPMTQLHEEEMVLPAQYANTIRALAAGQMGEGAGGGGNNIVQVQASRRMTQRDADESLRNLTKAAERRWGRGWRPGQS